MEERGVCSYLSSNFEQIILGLLHSDEHDSAFELLVPLTSMNFVPQKIVIQTMLQTLIKSNSRKLSILVFKTLKQIQSLHPYNDCCTYLWRGASLPNTKESELELFEKLLYKLSEGKEDEDLSYFNHLLLFEYWISFFEEEQNYGELKMKDRSLHKLIAMAHRGGVNVVTLKKLIGYCIGAVLNNDPQTTFGIQKFLNLLICLYFNDNDNDPYLKGEIISTLYTEIKAQEYEDQALIFETFLHQDVKVILLDRILSSTYNMAEITSSNKKLQEQPVSIEKFIYFYYVLKPNERKKQNSYLHLVKSIAHLMQSFVASRAASLNNTNANNMAIVSTNNTNNNNNINNESDATEKRKTVDDLRSHTEQFAGLIREKIGNLPEDKQQAIKVQLEVMSFTVNCL